MAQEAYNSYSLARERNTINAMMASKSVIIILLLTVAYTHGRITSEVQSNALSKTEKEGRTLIEVPIIGSILMLAFKVTGLVVSSVSSLLEFKLSIAALASSLAAWVLENYISVLVGTAVIVGFCYMTSYSEPVYEVDYRLIEAARSLDQGIQKYGNY